MSKDIFISIKVSRQYAMPEKYLWQRIILNKMARTLAFTKWAGMTHFKAPILNLYSHYITTLLMSFYILSIFLVLTSDICTTPTASEQSTTGTREMMVERNVKVRCGKNKLAVI